MSDGIHVRRQLEFAVSTPLTAQSFVGFDALQLGLLLRLSDYCGGLDHHNI